MNTLTFGPRDNQAGSGTTLREDRAVPGAKIVPVISQYLSIVRRRKWVIITSLAATLLLGLVVTLLMTPLYRAESTLEIQREGRNFTMVNGAEPEAAQADTEFYETQYGLLQSRSLAMRVVTSLRLQDSPEFFGLFKSKAATDWFANGKPIPNKSTRDQRIRAAGDMLLANLNVAPVRLSRLVRVGFTSPDPDFSVRVVNAWGNYFIEQTLDRRYNASSYARKFLENRLEQLRARIDESERRLVAYASAQGIVNVPTGAVGAGTGAGERSLTAEDLASLNQELARSTADRIQAQSRLGAPLGEVREALENTAISTLRQRRAEMNAEYARMMATFKPDYPPAQEVQAQMARLDRSISAEEQRIRSSLQQTYNAAMQRETALKARVDGLKLSLLDLRSRSIQYNIIQRDADTNRQLYDALLQRYKEIGVAGGVGINNISIVDAAEKPIKPWSPRLILNLAVAMILGLVIGGGIALALESLDQGISDPSDVEDAIDVPLLGTIPKVAEGSPAAALRDRKSVTAEAYLSLQTNLGFSTDHGVPRTLAVTSSRPSEGKSTTSYALAASLARLGRKVLLVDADMRSPSMHHMFGFSNDRGLSNYLSGDDQFDSLLMQAEQEHVTVLVSGPQPPNAAELLSGDRLTRMLAIASEKFDHIVFDMPPVMGLADAPLVGGRMEGVVFVIEAHSTQQSMARVAVDRLRLAGANIVGAVLTKFQQERGHFGYGYSYGYGYGYGDTAAKS